MDNTPQASSPSTDEDHGWEGWERDFLSALGYLVVQSGYLESDLAEIVWVVGLNDRNSLLTEQEFIQKISQTTLGELVKMVYSAVPKVIRSQPILAQLDGCRPALDRAVAVRNQFIHAEWIFVPQYEAMNRRRRSRPKAGLAVETEHRMATPTWSRQFEKSVLLGRLCGASIEQVDKIPDHDA